MKAIRYRNLDEARQALQSLSEPPARDVLDDAGHEPLGLLSVIAEDLVGEELFYRMFDGKNGTLVEVERIDYSGFGAPAEEDDYMGFANGRFAYVLSGKRLPIEILDCPLAAVDIHHLEAQVLDGEHPLDRTAVASTLQLSESWDFDDLWELIRTGELTAQEVDELIHKS